MIRRYNYTGRKKLSEIRINEWAKKDVKYFEVICDLRNSGFPDDAKIFIEPYFKSSFLRFDFGTIARFQPPTNTEISSLPTTDQLWYRIKIVDESSKHGLILGTADIQGIPIDSPHSGKQSILPVDFVELGNRIWTLEFRAERPVLAVNSLLTDFGIREKVKQGDFFTLVYPEVIKMIALRLETEEGFYDEGLLAGKPNGCVISRKYYDIHKCQYNMMRNLLKSGQMIYLKLLPESIRLLNIIEH